MKKTDIDEIWQLQIKQSLVSLIPDKMLQEVLSLMLQARNLMLLNMGYLKQYFILFLIN